jgi:hypothetical protein
MIALMFYTVCFYSTQVLDKAVFGDMRIYEALDQHPEGKKAVKRYK